MTDPASWKLHGPDQDGFVWLWIDKGEGSFEMVNMGKLDEVREKLGNALEEWKGR